MNIPVVSLRYYLKPSAYCMYRCVSLETNSALFPQSVLFLYRFQRKYLLSVCTELLYLVLYQRRGVFIVVQIDCLNILRLKTWRPGFDPSLVRLRFVVDEMALGHLTFRGPCIVSTFLLIYFQRDATLHSSFISGKLLCMFRVVSPPIIRSTQLYLQYLVLVNRYCYLPLLWESGSWPECVWELYRSVLVRPQYSTAVERRPCCTVALRRTAWSEHGMTSVN